MTSGGGGNIGGHGTVMVDGAGSSWNAGDQFDAGTSTGTAMVNITHGGTVTANSSSLHQIGGVGSANVTVSDSGSSLTLPGTVQIGLGGAVVKVLNGAAFTSDSMGIGIGSAQVTVDGAGSTLNLTGGSSNGLVIDATVAGPATLSVQNGAR
ncbi:MAG: hypothetical protein WDN28_15675 [Chthoniobacter sp.]